MVDLGELATERRSLEKTCPFTFSTGPHLTIFVLKLLEVRPASPGHHAGSILLAANSINLPMYLLLMR